MFMMGVICTVCGARYIWTLLPPGAYHSVSQSHLDFFYKYTALK